MSGLNLDAIGSYSGIGADTPMTGFGGTSGFGSANPNTSGGGGFLGGFGNFLNSNFMSNVGGPLLSAGLSGFFTNQAAKNYGQSAYQATELGALAGKEAALMDFGFGERSQELAQQRRQDDARFQLNLQKSKPFQDLVTRGIGMQIAAQDAPGSEMRAGRFMTMFG
jgi:hypothetical protein